MGLQCLRENSLLSGFLLQGQRPAS